MLILDVDPPAQRWAFEATVYKSRACRGFVGFGDANPSNVSSLVQGAELRSRKPERLTALSAKRTGLAFARSRRSVPLSSRNRLEN